MDPEKDEIIDTTDIDMGWKWHDPQMVTSRPDLIKPINNRMVLLGDALIMFFLEKEDVEYFKAHADEVKGIHINPLAVGVFDREAFRENLTEVVKYVIFDNQNCIDAVTMCCEDAEIYQIMRSVCEENRTYISEKYIYWPEVDDTVFNIAFTQVTGSFSEDQYRGWFITVSKEVTEVKFLLATETHTVSGEGGDDGSMGGDTPGGSSPGLPDTPGADGAEKEGLIDIDYPDLPDLPEDGYWRWEEEVQEDEEGGGGGGDEGGEGESSTTIIYKLYAVAYKYVLTLNMKGMFSRMLGNFAGSITMGHASFSLIYHATPDDPGAALTNGVESEVE